MGIISEDEEGWKRRADFLVSFLKSEGKTVTMHGTIRYLLAYSEEDDGEHYKEVLRQIKSKSRSKYSFSRKSRLHQLLSYN